MKVQELPPPFDALTDVLRTEELYNVFMEHLQFSVSGSKLYALPPGRSKPDGISKAQELYSSLLIDLSDDDKQNN